MADMHLTTIDHRIGVCPGCEKPLVARANIELEYKIGPDGKTVVGEGQIVGIAFNHDCIPKVTR